MASKVKYEKDESRRQRDRSNYVRSGIKIGAYGDKFEQEADAVAKKVLMPPGVKVAEPMTTPAVNSAGNMAASQVSDLQMKCEDCEKEDKIQLFSEPGSMTGSSGEDEEDNGSIMPKRNGSGTPQHASPAISDAIRQSSGNGRPLDSTTREEMGSKIGADFRDVKIHTDHQAAQMNRDLGAKAFTHGQDIYFNQGTYNLTGKQGKHLLAHELTHVVQQKRKSTQFIQRSPLIPEQPTKKTTRYEISVTTHPSTWTYYLREDVQWHVAKGIGIMALAVYLAPKLRNTTSELIADTAVNAFLRTGMSYEAGKKKFLKNKIVKELKAVRGNDDYYFLMFFKADEIRNCFLEGEFKELIAQHKKSTKQSLLLAGHLLASANIPTKKGSGLATVTKMNFPTGEELVVKSYKKRPDWLKLQKKELTKRIEATRKTKPVPQDLPDAVQEWYKGKSDEWYLNVWVYFGTSAKEKSVTAIKLIPDEEYDELFKRVRKATSQAYVKVQEKRQRKKEKEMPKWARTLKREVEKLIKKMRKEDPEIKNVPDKIELVMERDTEKENVRRPSRITSKEVEKPKVFFRIWVQRGKIHIQRKSGIVPWPLSDHTSVSQIMPMIMQLTVILREFEKSPMIREAKIIPRNDKLALSAFPAMIKPVNLPHTNVSVTEAKNKFRMSLDFESVYGGGQLKDLYIASKLYQQYIHYHWSIYKVPESLKVEKGKGLSKSWETKWNQLYDLYNPTMDTDEESGATFKMPPKAGARVDKDDSSDSTIQLTFPDTPGDYLIHCVTASAPIGKHKLKRASSEAYYPVRLRPIKEVARDVSGMRTTAMKMTVDEIKSLKNMLADQEYSEQQRSMFRSVERMKSDYLKRALAKETGSLTGNIASEITFIDKTVKQLRTLESILPRILKQAEKENVPPSQLLIQKDTDLLDLYWYIIWDKKTVNSYKKELLRKKKDLEVVQKRAGVFKGRIKSSSKYQYTPEAAFVSRVTGQVYPLILMLGESPDSNTDEIEYNLVDITSKQSRRVYTGSSSIKGKKGHTAAIKEAFEKFGDKAIYGEGIIAIRMPGGAPLSGTNFIESEKGTLEKTLYILGIIAAVAGAAALVATGVGAPAAAAWLAFVAGVAGAATAIYNIHDRSKRHTLAWDAEMAIDILGIISIIPITAGFRLSRLPSTIRGFNQFRIVGRYIQVYSWSETGATLLLIPLKLKQDFDKIDVDVANGDLTKKQAEAIKSKLIANAALTGLMMLGAAAGSRQGAKMYRRKMPIQQRKKLDQQAKFVEMEGVVREYKTIKERGWVDKDGNWTARGKQIMGGKKMNPAQPEPTPTATKKEVPPQPAKAPPKQTKAPSQIEPPQPAKKRRIVEREVKTPKEGGDPAVKGTKSIAKKTAEPVQQKPETIEDKIRLAETDVTTRKADHDHFKAELKSAKAGLRGKRGTARKEAQKKVREAQEMLELARQDMVLAQNKATQLRQQKLSKAVKESEDLEAPWLDKISEQQKEQKRINNRITDKLKERDQLRDWIRGDFHKNREQVQQKVKRLEQLQKQLKSLNISEANARKKLKSLYETVRPLQAGTRKKMEALAAEQRAAKGITEERYQWLRKRSPNSKRRNEVRRTKRDEVYDVPIEGTPRADHIVSMNEITQMEGFSRLSKRQQLEVLNLKDNFMALDQRVNSSKGDRSISKWRGHPEFGTIPAAKRKALLLREARIKKLLRKEIDARDPTKQVK